MLIGMSAVLVLWVGSFHVLLWDLTHRVPKLPALSQQTFGDLATLLFGTSGIALGVFTLLIGGGALIGWQAIENLVQNAAERATRARMGDLERELRGRFLAAIGMLLGLFYARSEKPDQDEEEKAVRADYLAESVQHCWQAYKLLKDTEGNGKYMALNNFLYFSSMQGSIGTRGGTRGFLLEKAEELRRIGEEKNFWDGLLTYCAVVSIFGDEIRQLRDARDLSLELLDNKELTGRQKKEAALYAALLAKKLAEQSARTKNG
jgi:hypothetical protein